MPARSASARRSRRGSIRPSSGQPKEAAILLAGAPDATRHRAPDVGSVADIDIGSAIPVAARSHVVLQHSEPEHRTITAAFIDLMDTDRLLRRGRPGRVGRGTRRAHLVDPGGGPSLRGALLRDGRRQVERQGPADGGRAIQHRARRGADAPRAAGDHGPPGHRADAHRREHREGVHGRLRAAVPPGVSGVRRRDQHGGSGHGQGGSRPDPRDRDRPRALADRVRGDADHAVRGEGQGRAGSRVDRRADRSASGRSSAIASHSWGARREIATIVGVLDQVRLGTGWTVELEGEPGVGQIEAASTTSSSARRTSSSCARDARSTRDRPPYFPMRSIMRADPWSRRRRGCARRSGRRCRPSSAPSIRSS